MEKYTTLYSHPLKMPNQIEVCRVTAKVQNKETQLIEPGLTYRPDAPLIAVIAAPAMVIEEKVKSESRCESKMAYLSDKKRVET